MRDNSDSKLSVFVDESGSTLLRDQEHGNRFYVSAAVIVPSAAVEQLSREVEEICVQFNSGRELKSAEIAGKHRRRVFLLQKIANLQFEYIAFACDKSKVDQECGLRYKQSFYKNLNGRLYSRISKMTIGELDISIDSYGAPDYQKSAMKYFDERCDFFSHVEFHPADDRRSPLVQVADMVAGSIRVWLNDGGNVDYEHVQMRELLKAKEINLECWPVRFSDPETIPVDVKTGIDHDVARVMFKKAAEIIEFGEQSEKTIENMQAQVLKVLIEMASAGKKNVYCDKLLEIVNRGRPHRIGRKAFLSEVIGGIRKQGIVIAGTNKGYRLATSISDLNAYLQQDRTVILPMLSKLACARRLLRTAIQYDFVGAYPNEGLSVLLEAIENRRLDDFAAHSEIDDEKAFGR